MIIALLVKPSAVLLSSLRSFFLMVVDIKFVFYFSLSAIEVLH